MFREMTPYIEGIVREVRLMLPILRKGERLPRFTPQVRFPFADGMHFRQGMPYTLWMTQRLLGQLKSLPQDETSRVSAAIKAIGGESFLALDIPCLQRQGLHAAVG